MVTTVETCTSFRTALQRLRRKRCDNEHRFFFFCFWNSTLQLGGKICLNILLFLSQCVNTRTCFCKYVEVSVWVELCGLFKCGLKWLWSGVFMWKPAVVGKSWLDSRSLEYVNYFFLLHILIFYVNLYKISV